MIHLRIVIGLASVVAFGLTVGSASAQTSQHTSVGVNTAVGDATQQITQIAPVPNISGVYRIAGYPTEVRQRGGQLLFINEWGSISRGVFLSPTVVQALDWDFGLIGVLNRNRIEWANGTVWFKR